MGEGYALVESRFENGSLIFETVGGTELMKLDGANSIMIPKGAVLTKRQRFTVAEVNAGDTLLPALTGYKYRIVDITLIAIGGNASGATSVEISGTQSTSSVDLFSAAAAALTQSAVVKPDTANMTVLADGASFVACDSGAAVTISKTGSALATSTHIDVIVSYALEAA